LFIFHDITLAKLTDGVETEEIRVMSDSTAEDSVIVALHVSTQSSSVCLLPGPLTTILMSDWRDPLKSAFAFKI